MSIFDSDSGMEPVNWMREKILALLEDSAKMIDLANESDTTKWYSEKLREMASGMIYRLVPMTSLLFSAGEDAASPDESKAIIDGGSLALARWCKKWDISDWRIVAQNAITTPRSAEDDEEKSLTPEETLLSADDEAANEMRLEICQRICLKLLDENIPDAARRILAWAGYHLGLSQHADVVKISKRFLPGDIQRTPQDTSEGYRALYELRLIERIDGLSNNNDVLALRIAIDGLNSSKHPSVYRDEVFGFEGARVNGESTFSNDIFVKIPDKLSRFLTRDASVIRNKLPELKLLLKNSISPERVFISDVEYLPAGESSKYPSLRISFRQPLSCLSTTTVEEHITVTTNAWLKSIVVL